MHKYLHAGVCVPMNGVHTYKHTHNHSAADPRTGNAEPSLCEVASLILTPSVICKTTPISKTTETV